MYRLAVALDDTRHTGDIYESSEDDTQRISRKSQSFVMDVEPEVRVRCLCGSSSSKKKKSSKSQLEAAYFL
jgi:hypothetical protein